LELYFYIIKPIAILVEEQSDVQAFKDYTGESNKAQETSSIKPTESAKAEEIKHTTTSKEGDRLFISPIARKEADNKSINLKEIHGSGPNGRIILSDVVEHKPAAKAQTISDKPQLVQQVQPKVEAPKVSDLINQQYEDIELSSVRKIIADRLLFSKTNIPHFYLGIECNMDKLLALRTELNKHSTVKLSINDVIIKAASLACMKVPETNSSWQGNFVRKYKNVDMSIAVQTDHGLITPIITNSNLKGLSEISKEVKDLADRAKQRKLKPQEFQGGTFTISNLGMMGITNFSAIINPPQSCIVAIGKTEKKVIFDENAINKEQPYK
jgi:pyruvate dehydrogenase E2 component (dihydrolipoamide acetyltransferase)